MEVIHRGLHILHCDIHNDSCYMFCTCSDNNILCALLELILASELRDCVEALYASVVCKQT